MLCQVGKLYPAVQAKRLICIFIFFCFYLLFICIWICICIHILYCICICFCQGHLFFVTMVLKIVFFLPDYPHHFITEYWTNDPKFRDYLLTSFSFVGSLPERRAFYFFSSSLFSAGNLNKELNLLTAGSLNEELGERQVTLVQDCGQAGRICR